MVKDNVDLSVVIPIYNNAAFIPILIEEIASSLDGLVMSYELIFIDDRSPDNAWEALADVAATHNYIKAIRLNRNSGQHIALAAGIRESEGKWVLTMDGDMQDHPKDIARFWQKAQEGRDIVLAYYDIENRSALRSACNKAFAKCLSLVSQETIAPNIGSMTLFSRKVADAYCQFDEPYRHHLHILYWLQFDIGYTEYTKHEQTHDTSGYDLKKLINHAIDGLFLYSTNLLYLVIIIGVMLMFIASLLGAYALFHFIFYSPTSGWTSLVLLIISMSGLIICSIGVVGIYIGKIFKQTQNRPLYIVDESINCQSGRTHGTYSL